MKITDIQTFQFAGPELAEVMYPAWAPGTEWKRWGGTIVKVFTDEGIVGLGSPGYAAAPIIESWIKPQLSARTRSRWSSTPASSGTRGRPGASRWPSGTSSARPAASRSTSSGAASATASPATQLHRGPHGRAARRGRCRPPRQGWRAAKLRLHDWTIKEDIAQVEAVRRAMGDDFTSWWMPTRPSSPAPAARARPGLDLRARPADGARTRTARRLLAGGAARPLRLRGPDPALRRRGDH